MDGWLPVKIIPVGGELLCKWMFTGNTSFSDPFFSDTLLRCKQYPENKHHFNSVSSFHLLKEWIKEKSALKPAAFIFHVSRCGSTTLAQLLDLDPANRVLSEVPFLDEILRLPFTHPGSEHAMKAAEYFHAALNWYALPHASEQRLFIKTDSWHLHFYPLLRKLYPDVPFIIITRSPAAVLHSQRRQRGIQAIPGMLEPALFGFDQMNISFDLDRHMEKVLESYYARIINICRNDPQVSIVNYDDGMENMLRTTLRLANADMPAGFEKAVTERLLFDGKNPRLYFNPVVTETKVEVSARCMELYQQCQSFRSEALADDKSGEQR